MTSVTPSGRETSATTFVLCVESGPLEAMAVLAVQSLRRFGGVVADAPVLAVTPRLGPPLTSATRARFDELGVRHVWLPHVRRAWFPWMGKIRAVIGAQRLAETEAISFIDCDVLFVRDAPKLLLGPEVDVTAGYPDNGIVGTSGPGSRYESAWRRACEAVGMAVDDLPWVEPGDGSGRIRFYLNGGVLTCRRESGVPQRWLEYTEAMFRARADFGPWREKFHEQISLGLAILASGEAFAALPYAYNYGIDTSIPDALRSPELADARILHYHDQLDPANWETTVARLEQTHPEVSAWLADRQPITDPTSAAARHARRLLQRGRDVSRRAYRLPGWIQRKRGREILLGSIHPA